MAASSCLDGALSKGIEPPVHKNEREVGKGTVRSFAFCGVEATLEGGSAARGRKSRGSGRGPGAGPLGQPLRFKAARMAATSIGGTSSGSGASGPSKEPRASRMVSR